MVTFQRFHPSSSQKLRAAAMMTGELRMGAMRESDTESQAADMHRLKNLKKKQNVQNLRNAWWIQHDIIIYINLYQSIDWLSFWWILSLFLSTKKHSKTFRSTTLVGPKTSLNSTTKASRNVAQILSIFVMELFKGWSFQDIGRLSMKAYLTYLQPTSKHLKTSQNPSIYWWYTHYAPIFAGWIPSFCYKNYTKQPRISASRGNITGSFRRADQSSPAGLIQWMLLILGWGRTLFMGCVGNIHNIEIRNGILMNISHEISS